MYLPEPHLKAIEVVGHALVLAGPGTGKTTLQVQRIKRLLSGVSDPFSILVLQFTRQDAEELNLRLGFELPDRRERIQVHTLYSFCLSVLRSYIGYLGLGLSPSFTLCDENDQERHFHRALQLERCYYLPSRFQMLNDLVRLKDRGEEPPEDGSVQARVFRRYQTELTRHNSIDFGDLIRLTTLLFRKQTSILGMYRAAYPHLIVDRFEDLSPLQYELLKLLTPPSESQRTVTAVADANQAIFSFRGASLECLRSFASDYKATVVNLAYNYRNARAIWDTAYQVIRPLADGFALSTLPSPVREEPGEVYYWEFDDDEAEARYLAHFLQKNKIEGQASPSIAILGRSRRLLDRLHENLSHCGVKAHIVSKSDYERTPDVSLILRLCHLSLDNSPAQQSAVLVAVDTLDLFDSGESGQERRMNWAQKVFQAALSDNTRTGHQRFDQLLTSMDIPSLLGASTLDRGEKKGRSANFSKFVSIFRRALDLFGGDLRRALGEVEHEDCVPLMTVHASVGYEFATVVICGFEAPSWLGANTDEERRLAYVAITRASRTLVLTRAAIRMGRKTRPSPYLADIPPELLNRCLQ